MNRDELPIASPCHADFAQMSPVAALRGARAEGRFCGDCKKVVHDLSKLTEREARALLSAPRTEGLCIRYLYDEAGEMAFRRELGLKLVPARSLTRYVRAAAAAASLALPLSLNACMGAAPSPGPKVPMPGDVSEPPTADDAGAPVTPEAEDGSSPVAPTATEVTPDVATAADGGAGIAR